MCFLDRPIGGDPSKPAFGTLVANPRSPDPRHDPDDNPYVTQTPGLAERVGPALGMLPERERAVLAAFALGQRDRETAAQLRIHRSTVCHARKRGMRLVRAFVSPDAGEVLTVPGVAKVYAAPIRSMVAAIKIARAIERDPTYLLLCRFYKVPGVVALAEEGGRP